MRFFYKLLDRVWDKSETHIGMCWPDNHAKGLAEMLSVENFESNSYILFYKEVRAFRKLRQKERVKACARYLVLRFPKKYRFIRNSKDRVTTIPQVFMGAVEAAAKEDRKKDFIIRIPCRVICHDNFTDEPMDLDIPVRADSSYDATRHVELNLRELIKKGTP